MKSKIVKFSFAFFILMPKLVFGDSSEGFTLSIQQDPHGYNGLTSTICIEVTAGKVKTGIFDLLIGYDSLQMKPVDVRAGSFIEKYDWDYFTYRYMTADSGYDDFPNGLIRIVGLSHQGFSTIPHDSIIAREGETFACIDFRVSNDRNYSCAMLPVRWVWDRCLISAMGQIDSDTIFISDQVIDYYGTSRSTILGKRKVLTGLDTSLPTLSGLPDECIIGEERLKLVRSIEFVNGGVEVSCDSIDARGDLNLNGYNYEKQDIELYTQYFTFGIEVFSTIRPAQIQASNTNGDTIPLTIADLVYMTRIFNGDAKHEDELNIGTHETLHAQVTNGIVSTDRELGGVYLEYADEVDVKLLAENMTIRTGVVDGRTQVIVYPPVEYGSFESIKPGDIIQSSGRLLRIEVSDYDGAPIETELALPQSFAVHQNYPNPFNPSTKIAFDVTTPSNYSVQIYNISGQIVETIDGTAAVGRNEVVWDASDFASGVYLYKVTAGVNSQSRKMVLLK